MFFSSRVDPAWPSKYHLLLEAARYADDAGFEAIWTPERHFNKFGGIFPNPALTSAALATITERVQLRAGSLVSVLHDEIRVAEEWSVVDNLSRGRVGVSFGSGWNANDFIFFPDRYERRDAIMYEQIETVQRLWRGESVLRRNDCGRTVEVRIQPTPVQPSLPVWITAAGNPRTFERAGGMGANLLTHIIGQSREDLAHKIRRYRQAREANGHAPEAGVVTLMLHTFMGADLKAVVKKAWTPFRQYIRDAVELEIRAALGGGTISQGYRMPGAEPIDQDVLEELLDVACERYMRGGALIGTAETCGEVAAQFEEIGVGEIACLIDFGIPAGDVLASLRSVNELRVAMATGQICAAAPHV
jgi:natural product biosynthesis luciferase-like monooxygenase protein